MKGQNTALSNYWPSGMDDPSGINRPICLLEIISPRTTKAVLVNSAHTYPFNFVFFFCSSKIITVLPEILVTRTAQSTRWLQVILNLPAMFLSTDVIFMKDAYLEEHLETCFFSFNSECCDWIVSTQNKAPGKGKFPVLKHYATKTCGGNEAIVPCIRNIGSRWR
jgi:hypothetical protein